MREILFRGKETETGAWYYGVFFPHKKTTYCFKEDYEAHPENDEQYIVFDEMTDWGMPNRVKCATVIPETVGQYTGMMDKNGKKIFEGDIVRAPDIVHNGEIQIKGRTGAVSMEQGCFFVRSHEGLNIRFLYSIHEDCEVIGNIWDNPELME